MADGPVPLRYIGWTEAQEAGVYRLVNRGRYRWFGKLPLDAPTSEEKHARMIS